MNSIKAPRAGGVVDVDLVAGRTRTIVAGQTVDLLAYNGVLPGPSLRLREGERVRLRLTNRLSEPTNLHLHGLHIPPAVEPPEKLVGAEETAVYEFDVLPGSAGTYWYHPHAHGRVAEQLFGGLAGSLIVDGRDDLAELEEVDEEVLLLKDLAIEGSRVAPHIGDDWLNGKEGELVLVNGEPQPRITTPTGIIRLRVINACNARYFLLHLEGHALTVLGAGTGFAEEPASVDSLLLAPGERADMLVILRHTGDVRLVSLPYDRGADMSGMDAMAESPTGGHAHGAHGPHGHEATGSGGDVPPQHGAAGRLGNKDAIVLATLTGTKITRAPRLPARLAALPSYDPRDAKRRRRIVFSEEMGPGPVRFLLNGRSYEPGRVDFESELGSFEIWDLVNEADMDHPFHLHVYPFIVLSRNDEPEPIRMWRDTVNLSEGEHVEILVPFEDFAGNVLYHCHLAEHEDRGMMALLAVTSQPSGPA